MYVCMQDDFWTCKVEIFFVLLRHIFYLARILRNNLFFINNFLVKNLNLDPNSFFFSFSPTTLPPSPPPPPLWVTELPSRLLDSFVLNVFHACTNLYITTRVLITIKCLKYGLQYVEYTLPNS